MKKTKLAILSLFALAASAMANQTYHSFVIAETNYQWTGIAITQSGRIFVNFPTWNVPSPYKVAEIINGKTVAYPSQALNDNEFIAVQSVVVDDANRLWVLDTGNPQFKGVVKGKAKLFLIDTKINKIAKEYSFPANVALEKSYLNDVRVDTKRQFAYLTDSTLGGIVVLNLKTGESWRGLTSSVKAVQAKYDRLNFPTTGEWINTVASDGIELSKDGNTLYFTALTGDVLYQMPTVSLRDKNVSVAEREKEIVTLNSNNVATDGMLLLNNKLYMGDLPKESIWVYDLKTNKGSNIDLGYPIRWADSLDSDKFGAIYFTTSQINYPSYDRETYKIIKFVPLQSKDALYKPIVEHDINRNLTPLHKAVASGDIDKVKALIKQGANVNALDKLMGIAPLHIAVQRHNPDMVKLLVENGAFINLQSVRLGGTPLFLAVWHRNVAAVEYLLSLPDIDTTVLGAAGATALQFNRGGKYAEDTSLNQDVAQINDLFAAHKKRIAKQGRREAAIHAVVMNNRFSEAKKISEIRKLIAKGHDVNAIAPVLKKGSDFHTALLVAALKNQLGVAKLLLENGADQRIPGAYMAAIALHKAAYMGHADMLRLLSHYSGYNEVLNAQGPNNGYTPLHDAVWHGHLEAAKVLVETGARLDLVGFDGNTPEQLAIQSGYPSIAKYLKEVASSQK